MTTTSPSAGTARGLWTLYEPIHALSYFAPEAAAEFEQAGLHGFWRGYFAGRSAPLGAVAAPPVIALFAGFAPRIVEQALPAVWDLVTPEQALTARRRGGAAAIRRCLHEAGVTLDHDLVDELNMLVDRLPFAGRALAASNAAVPLAEDPYERLWQLVTTLREWRGDAHVAALVGLGLAGIDVLVLRCLLDQPREWLQRVRGWTDHEWDEATHRLTDAGLITGGISDAGRSVIAAVEQTTDDRSMPGPPDLVRRLTTQLAPVAHACATALPFPNPIGVPAPVDPP